MSTVQEQNKALVRDYLARLDADDRGVVQEVYSPDGVFHFPGSPPMDFAAFVEMVEMVYTAFPDLTHRIEELLAVGDRVVARLTDSGTHQGEFEGAAPTGKHFSIGAIVIMAIRDGKIVEAWEEIDMLGLLQQIGALPEHETAGA